MSTLLRCVPGLLSLEIVLQTSCDVVQELEDKLHTHFYHDEHSGSHILSMFKYTGNYQARVSVTVDLEVTGKLYSVRSDIVSEDVYKRLEDAQSNHMVYKAMPVDWDANREHLWCALELSVVEAGVYDYARAERAAAESVGNTNWDRKDEDDDGVKNNAGRAVGGTTLP